MIRTKLKVSKQASLLSSEETQHRFLENVILSVLNSCLSAFYWLINDYLQSIQQQMTSIREHFLRPLSVTEKMGEIITDLGRQLNEN